MAKHVFCRDLCLERGEPHEGTGNAPKRALLLAWPRGKWRTPRWDSVDMSPAMADAIHKAAQGGLHVALVDRVGASDALPQLMAQPESVSADFTSEAALIAAINDYAAGTVFAGTFDPRITIVVCTDSRRDACCARYGFSTYKALVEIADKSRFHIVQATHIGGCRFAASLLVLPHRQRYGRMTAGQTPAFLEALAGGQIFLPAYKGRTDTPEPLQVAELAALRWAEDNKLAERDVDMDITALPQNVSDDARPGDVISLSARIGTRRLDIALRAQTFHVQGNCGIVAASGGTHDIRWCLHRIEAV